MDTSVSLTTASNSSQISWGSLSLNHSKVTISQDGKATWAAYRQSDSWGLKHDFDILLKNRTALEQIYPAQFKSVLGQISDHLAETLVRKLVEDCTVGLCITDDDLLALSKLMVLGDITFLPEGKKALLPSSVGEKVFSEACCNDISDDFESLNLLFQGWGVVSPSSQWVEYIYSLGRFRHGYWNKSQIKLLTTLLKYTHEGIQAETEDFLEKIEQGFLNARSSLELVLEDPELVRLLSDTRLSLDVLVESALVSDERLRIFAEKGKAYHELYATKLIESLPEFIAKEPYAYSALLPLLASPVESIRDTVFKHLIDFHNELQKNTADLADFVKGLFFGKLIDSQELEAYDSGVYDRLWDIYLKQGELKGLAYLIKRKIEKEHTSLKSIADALCYGEDSSGPVIEAPQFIKLLRYFSDICPEGLTGLDY